MALLSLGFGLALPSWGVEVLALPSRENVLALPLLGPVRLSHAGGWPCPCSSWGWPLLLGVWCLALPSRCVVVWPFLVGVGVGPSFSGPSVFLTLVVGPSFLACGGLSPAFLGFGLALPFWGVVVGPAFSEYVGPPLSGLGLACLSSGGNWTCLFGVGVVPSFLR